MYHWLKCLFYYLRSKMDIVLPFQRGDKLPHLHFTFTFCPGRFRTAAVLGIGGSLRDGKPERSPCYNRGHYMVMIWSLYWDVHGT